MTLTRIKLQHFTAFETLDVSLSPGVNIFIGENGTGKTHLLKVAYAACDITKTKGSFAGKLARTFLPYQGRIGRLVHRAGKSSRASVEVYRDSIKVRSSFSNHTKEPRAAAISGKDGWGASEIESVYIPVKEVLANAPGFRSMYASRDIAFEEIYADLIDRAFRPLLRGPQEARRKKLLQIIQKAIEGQVLHKEENFFLRNKHGELEFTLLSEGMRKLALLWLLLQNGTLLSGSVLFWDEPEANLNPKKVGTLVDILLELQRMGVQILLATHDYVVLKEFHLRAKSEDDVSFHSLYRDDHEVVQHQSTADFMMIAPNAITDTFADLYDREVRRSLQVP